MVGTDSTPGPSGAPMLAGSTLPQAQCILYRQSGMGVGAISGHFKATIRRRCPKLI